MNLITPIFTKKVRIKVAKEMVLPKFKGVVVSVNERTGKLIISRRRIKKFSAEQRDRYSAALKCLELSQASFAKIPDEGALVKTACEYGSGIGLTKRECKKVLNMEVRDLIRLGI